MLGVIYLVLCMLIGKEPAGLLLSKKSGYNQIWLTLAAAFGTGGSHKHCLIPSKL